MVNPYDRGKHMAVTSSDVVRIWIIMLLAMYLFSGYAEELLSMTRFFFSLCLSTYSSLCLG